MTSGRKHDIRELLYAKKRVFCVGTSFTMLENFVNEWRIVNGAITIVYEILYENHGGATNNVKCLPAYVFLDFNNLVPKGKNSYL